MGQHVGIRMPVQSARVRYVHAANDEVASLDEGVHVHSLPYPQVTRVECGSRPLIAHILLHSALPAPSNEQFGDRHRIAHCITVYALCAEGPSQ